MYTEVCMGHEHFLSSLLRHPHMLGKRPAAQARPGWSGGGGVWQRGHGPEA